MENDNLNLENNDKIESDININTSEFYYIIWSDVADRHPSWATIEDIESWDESTFDVEQLGFLVKEADDHYLFSSQIGNFVDEINIGNTTKIPKGIIKKMIKLITPKIKD